MGVDGGKGMGLGKRGRSIGGSMSRSMSGRVQKDLGSMVEGMTMGLGSAGGRITVVPETMAGERSMLRPKVGSADEFSGTGGFKPRGLGSLRGPDMGMYSKGMTQSMGSGVSRLGEQHLPRWEGGGLRCASALNYDCGTTHRSTTHIPQCAPAIKYVSKYPGSN